jgi:YfiH family protein
VAAGTGRLDSLDAELPGAVRGLFTTRYGGTSVGAWAQLNLANHVGDAPAAVAANRSRLADELGGVPLVALHQVHGRDVAVVDSAPPGPPTADAAVTSRPGLALLVMVADCMPVLIADSVAQVVGAVHAGRGGLAAGVLPRTVAAMTELGARPDRCAAVIGPAVCGRCYEVPEAMREEFEGLVPASAGTTRAGTPSIDLAAGAAAQLGAAGVGTVRRTEICTMEDDRFFSYRRDGITGRFAGVVMLTG